MTRLRTVSPVMPGWKRRRHGRGFVYLNVDAEPLATVEVERCRALVIPPAWTEVWICPIENGHLQAVGTDDAGRRQYLYHPAWRERQDRQKYDLMVEFAGRLPAARRRVSRDLRRDAMDLDRALATAFRLFDLGAFRIGSDRYAEENGSYGLLTLQRRHVRSYADGIAFDYVAKSGQERSISIEDARLREAIDAMRRRRGPADQRLLAYKEGSRWQDLSPEQVNAFIKERTGDEHSAKAFRTWHANVVAAAALAQEDGGTKAARKRAVAAAMREVAEFLGNTPAVARSGYVDPRLIDLFEDHTTIDPALAHRRMPQAGQALSPTLEKAVLALLRP